MKTEECAVLAGGLAEEGSRTEEEGGGSSSKRCRSLASAGHVFFARTVFWNISVVVAPKTDGIG